MGKGRHLRVGHSGALSHRRGLTLALVFTTVLAAGAVAWASHSSPFIDLTTADAVVTHDGAVFIQGGTGAGTGNFDPFLQVQETGGGADGVEMGYNTEPVANGEFDTKSITSGNTHKLSAASVPTLFDGTTLYREFSLDSNDTGNDSFMSIDEIKIFLDDQFALTGYDQGAETFTNDTGDTADKIYDLDENSEVTILANTQSLEPGSGVSDITVLIPDILFPEECYYGSLDCNQYIIFWTKMGGLTEDPAEEERDFDADSGFEEWRVRRQPVVDVAKTAATSLTRTHTWEITKDVTPATQDGFVGGAAGTSTWSVVVDETETDSAWTVSGSITITNPTDPDLGVFDDPQPAVIESVADAIDMETGTDYNTVTVTCPESLPFTLDAGEELVCTYSQVIADVGNGKGTNTATVEISDGKSFADSFDDTAAFDFAAATVNHSGPQSVTVDDDRDDEGNFPDTISGDASYDYDEDFTCSSDPDDYTSGVDVDDYDNTATIKDGTTLIDSDDATVTVTCYLPAISKTAAGTNDETHNWTIVKGEDATYHLFAADDVDHDYDIDLTETVIEDNFQVTGTVSLTNPHPTDAVTVTLADQLSDGSVATFTDCPDIDGATGHQVSIAANGVALNCAYTASDSGGDATSNTATFTLNGVSRSDTENFSYVPAVTDASVNVTDDYGTPDDAATPADETGDDLSFGPFSDGGDPAAEYTRNFACSSDPADYTGGTYSYTVINTASIDETGASDTATVTVHCYLPGVSKTAAGAYTETHTWTITKEADATYHLVAGDDVDHDYDITVDETITDSGFTVSGTVTVTNPHPTLGAVVTLSDALDDGTVVAFTDCPDIDPGTPGVQVTVPADGSKACAYSQAEDGDDGDATSNTATMVFDGITQTDTEGFTYVATPSGYDTVGVVDDNGTPDDAVTPEDETADDHSFPGLDDGDTGEYTRTFECSSDPADYTGGTYSYTVVNTARIVETGDDDDATVTVNCYLPLVAKTADTSFTRTYNWVIAKDALRADGTSVPAEGLEISEDQSYNLEWVITVDLDGTTPYTDSAWAVEGTVTVSNPAPVAGPSMTVDVSDVFTPDGGSAVPVSLDCDPVTGGDQNTGIVIAGGDSVDCTYSLGTDGTDGENVATATLDTGASNSDSEDVDFSDAAADITEVNATIQVTDTFEGGTAEVLGTASVNDTLPKSFQYFTLLSTDPTDNPDFLLQCGENTLDNQTDMYNYDGDPPTVGANLGFATRSVIVNVLCDTSCTLTQGYWKTHNDSFRGGAPTDETWDLVGPDAEQETFFYSGASWFEVFWTAPAGNAYYNLAHQWMAAYLNTLNEASVPTEVQAALEAAEAWFDNPVHTPTYAATLKGKEAKFLREWASTLDQYNNGLIGPGHCDEDAGSLVGLLPLLPLLSLAAPGVRRHLRRRGRYLERDID